MNSNSESRYAVPAVERAFGILEILVEASDAMGITELATVTGLPKSSLFMILNTFESHGFAEKDANGKYRLTLKLYNLAMRHLSQLKVRDVARPYLEDLSDGTGLTVHLAVLDSGKAVYIDKVEGPGFVQFATRVGQSLPLHLSGVGKALAAHMREDLLDAVLQEEGMERATDNTMTSPQQFKEFLTTVRTLGYAIEDEEGEIGVRCIGAPIFGADGAIVAAISVTGLRSEIPSVQFPAVGDKVRLAAEKISVALGYAGRAHSPA